VPLGPILEDEFGVPVFIGNDGDFFTYGEALAGFLPYVNGLLERAGSPKRYRNLFGITIGTGLGGGMVCNGDLVVGDNSCAGEAWILRNRLNPCIHAEEGTSIRAVQRAYADATRTACDDRLEPKAIFEIAMGRREGNGAAAIEAFRRLGTVAGDVLAQALTLVDGLAVIGGGISDAHPLFLPSLVDAMNDAYQVNGNSYRRLLPRAFNADDPEQLAALIRGDVRELTVPGSGRIVKYDSLQRTLVGVSKLGTSNAVAIGAYCFALSRLDRSLS
jgi:glucokinase